MDDGPEHCSQHATQEMLAIKKLSEALDFVAIFHRGRVAHGTH